MLLPDWHDKWVLVNTFTYAVMSDNVVPDCFLYPAQVLWEKWCRYNEPCSYGNQDECVIVEDRGVYLAQPAVDLTLSACLVSQFASINSAQMRQMQT